MKSNIRNMTQGNIPGHLIAYAVPTILGNLFQLTYNAADSIIVGRFLGEKALAAVGTANPIMNIVIFIIVGICMGAQVLMSEYFGEKDIPKLKREISTTILSGLVFTAFISLLGVLLSDWILALIKVPADLIGDASAYLRVIFMGLVFTFLYNAFAAALRSVGDAKTPLYFLMISSVANIVMDILFIVVFHGGVMSAALATVTAEFLSCVLCVVYIRFRVPMLQFSRQELVLDKKLLGKTVSYSWVTALQQSCLYIGKVLVQSAVNPLGVSTIAAFNAVSRVDDFVFTPEQSISHAMTTFIAQNRGAGRRDRIKGGCWTGLGLEVVYWIIIATVIYFAAPGIMGMFTQGEDAQLVPLGVSYLHAMVIFYLLPGITNGVQGYFRGMGDLKITLYSTFIQMAFRVVASYWLAPKLGILGFAYACFFGWCVMLLFELPFFFYSRYREKKLLQ